MTQMILDDIFFFIKIWFGDCCAFELMDQLMRIIEADDKGRFFPFGVATLSNFLFIGECALQIEQGSEAQGLIDDFFCLTDVFLI